MGLIKASLDSLRQSVGDQFLEVVSCPEVDNDVIVQRGVISHGSGNKTFTEGVISNGSAVIVPQGMAMMIVDNGKVVEFSAEPGTFKYESSSEPSVFCGGLGKGLIDTIKTIGQRITYGGQAARDQRVYYINIKVLPAIPFGSQQPEPIYDPVYGSVEVTYNGDFNIKVDDPVILVNTMLGANPKDTLTFDDIFTSDGGNILKGRFGLKVSEAISDLMTAEKVSFRDIQSKKSAICDKMNTLLNDEWFQKYGIIVTEVAIRINASEESKEQIREIDKVRGLANADAERVGVMSDAYSKNPQGAMAAASGEALLNASKNENGALGGFVGYGVAQNAGSNLMGAVAGMQGTAAKTCANCGQPVTGNFCSNCGQKAE
ncbi:MAG: SPFH domain-containing protein [Bacilli bacterium]|nr:SPFH domain-containing protein [Bacilli bacterium]